MAPNTKWLNHLKKVRKENPNMEWKKVQAEASRTYQRPAKKATKPQKATKPNKATKPKKYKFELLASFLPSFKDENGHEDLSPSQKALAQTLNVTIVEHAIYIDRHIDGDQDGWVLDAVVKANAKSDVQKWLRGINALPILDLERK